MPKPHLDRVVDVLRLFAPGARCQQEHSLPRDARRIDVVFGTRPEVLACPGTRPEVLA